MEKYGPHRCWAPKNGGGYILLTWEHEISAVHEACGYTTTSPRLVSQFEVVRHSALDAWRRLGQVS